jgi:peroxiredoxin
MADDPFADLGNGRPKRSAAERFEEEDRLNPEPDDPRRRRPEIRRPANRYAWVVGIVMLMGIGVLLLTTAIPNSGAGLEGPVPGDPLPQFAAPAAYGTLNGDANVCKEGGKCDGKGAGSVPACRVRSDQVVNSCELRDKPVVLTFLVTRGADCEPQVDRVERMRKQFPQVNFAAVVSGNDRAEVERIARRRGWTLPVAVDSDGAVVNLFGVGVCPTTVFARKGGRVRTTKLGNLTEAELRAQVRAVLAKR